MIKTGFTHNDMRALLRGEQGARICAQICREGGHASDRKKFQHDRPRYRCYSEITFKDTEWHGERDRFEREKYDHYRIDDVMCILPARDSINQEDCPVVGIELKGSESDLRAENELQVYLRYFDYLFFGVPSALADAAVAKIKEEGLTGDVGVMDVEAGRVVSMPRRHPVEPERSLQIFRRIQFGYLFGDEGGKVITVSVDPGWDQETVPPSDPSADAPPAAEPASSAAARAKERKKRARAVAAAGEALPDEIRSILSALPAKTQETYHFLRGNEGVRAGDIERHFGASEPTVRRQLGELVDSGLVEHRGSRKRGGYHPVHNAQKVASMQKCRECIVLKQLGISLPETAQIADCS